MTRITWTRIGIFVFTTVAAWAILSIGTSGTAGLQVEDLASRDYDAKTQAVVVDEQATADAKAAAMALVEDHYRHDEEAETDAFDALTLVITTVREGAVDTTMAAPRLNAPEPKEPSGETTTTSEGETTTTVPVMLMATGRLFVDGDGDGNLTEGVQGVQPDRGMTGIDVYLYDAFGTLVAQTETQSDGSWNVQVPESALYVAINGLDPDFPASLTLSTDNDLQELDCGAETCISVPVGYEPTVRDPLTLASELAAEFPTINREALTTLANLATQDVFGAAVGEESLLEKVNQAAQQRLLSEFGNRIQDNVLEVQQAIAAQPPGVLLGGTLNIEASQAAAALVNSVIRSNFVYDEAATVEAKNEAADQEPEVTVTFLPQQNIIRRGETLSAFHIAAIVATGAASGRPGQEAGLLAVMAVLVGALGFYLARFRPEFWTRPRMAALLGLLIVLGAAGVRLTMALQESVQDSSAWYALPGVVFGLLAAVLFDSRIAVLMAVAMAVLAATATRDPGVATYAMFSTLIPVGFVSSLSTRGSYRKAVLASAAVVAGIAAAVAWFFHTNPDQLPWNTMLQSAGWALGVSLLTALLGLAALQFFESAFDITTSLTLLEFTDRNHEALLLLQEKAFGTFNHSLMVGTLADAAARAVGADPLLARAAAYYHDLGKTENPSYFIENQFGAANPHDDLAPRQSVEIIRKHVTDGVELARKFRIPSEVAEAIVTHHGDGIMRFFYEKARLLEGNEAVDPDDFRHIGHKPRSAETAIVMLADSLEAACRAVFADEEPTPQAIEKVVARVVDEKMNDGQLSDSSLTLGQLSRARSAFFEALVGHYHQRIAYPNFPGS